MVYSATRGQAGQIRDASAATRHVLGAVREQELRQACEILGVRHVRCADYLDGALRDVDLDVLAAAVAEVMRAFRPDAVITFGEDGAYGHPDHVSISAAATRAFALVFDPAHGPGARLYHSHFARSRLLMRDRLATWLASLKPPSPRGPHFVPPPPPLAH